MSVSEEHRRWMLGLGPKPTDEPGCPQVASGVAEPPSLQEQSEKFLVKNQDQPLTPEPVTRKIVHAGIVIRDLQRDEHGHWRCELDAGEGPVSADRQYGSWQVQTDGRRRDVLPDVAALLQDTVRSIEKKEARAS